MTDDQISSLHLHFLSIFLTNISEIKIREEYSQFFAWSR